MDALKAKAGHMDGKLKKECSFREAHTNLH